MNKAQKILILCTGNSCRSQMAEGFLKSFTRSGEIEVVSAGTKPEPKINPLAVKVMAEEGIDISTNLTKKVEDYLEQRFDWVITVCDSAYKKCPYFAGEAGHRLHVAFEDPAEATGPEEEQLLVYRKVRDQIKQQFLKFYKEKLK